MIATEVAMNAGANIISAYGFEVIQGGWRVFTPRIQIHYHRVHCENSGAQSSRCEQKRLGFLNNKSDLNGRGFRVRIGDASRGGGLHFVPRQRARQPDADLGADGRC